MAFGKMMPLGARINERFSSDIGHFDVVDMRDPLPEAYELVEDGHREDHGLATGRRYRR